MPRIALLALLLSLFLFPPGSSADTFQSVLYYKSEQCTTGFHEAFVTPSTNQCEDISCQSYGDTSVDIKCTSNELGALPPGQYSLTGIYRDEKCTELSQGTVVPVGGCVATIGPGEAVAVRFSCDADNDLSYTYYRDVDCTDSIQTGVAGGCTTPGGEGTGSTGVFCVSEAGRIRGTSGLVGAAVLMLMLMLLWI